MPKNPTEIDAGETVQSEFPSHNAEISGPSVGHLSFVTGPSQVSNNHHQGQRTNDEGQLLDWRAAGLRYLAYNFHLRKKFGQRVQKVSIDAGFTCPNVDGTVAKGGCTFCDNRSFSPSRRSPRMS